MSRTFQWVIVAVIVALVGLFALSLQLNASGQVQSGAAPDVTLTRFDGTRTKLSEYRGQVVVLNIWASWCDPCKDEAAILENAWRDYRGKGVWFFGADYVDTDAPALAFIKQYNITYPNGPDVGSNIYRSFRARGVPETYIIGPQGTVEKLFVGPMTDAALRASLNTLVAQVSR